MLSNALNISRKSILSRAEATIRSRFGTLTASAWLSLRIQWWNFEGIPLPWTPFWILEIVWSPLHLTTLRSRCGRLTLLFSNRPRLNPQNTRPRASPWFNYWKPSPGMLGISTRSFSSAQRKCSAHQMTRRFESGICITERKRVHLSGTVVPFTRFSNLMTKF